jgi:hypothetical protein
MPVVIVVNNLEGKILLENISTYCTGDLKARGSERLKGAVSQGL